MFRKKECQKCGRKMNEGYDFCPYCGNHSGSSRNEDWGMLGKDDFFNDIGNAKLPMGFNSIFNFLMKNLDKQFSQMQKNTSEVEKKGISIDISNTGDGVPKIKIKTFGGNEMQNKKPVQKIKEAKSKNFSKEDVKKFLKLKRVEPKSEIRRFSDKVVYEVELPGVKSMEDVSVLKLENSVEIRAMAKEKAYVKILPINMPLINYSLAEEKLILELKA